MRMMLKVILTILLKMMLTILFISPMPFHIVMFMVMQRICTLIRLILIDGAPSVDDNEGDAASNYFQVIVVGM